MLIKQLSVFIENREGRLEDVTDVLLKNNINIQSLSLADTSEYGILRLIVSEPEKAKEVLRKEEFSASLIDVVAARISNDPGSLLKFLKICGMYKLNIEYMYALSTSKEDASMVIKFSDMAEAEKSLLKEGIDLYDADKAYNFNF